MLADISVFLKRTNASEVMMLDYLCLSLAKGKLNEND